MIFKIQEGEAKRNGETTKMTQKFITRVLNRLESLPPQKRGLIAYAFQTEGFACAWGWMYRDDKCEQSKKAREAFEWSTSQMDRGELVELNDSFENVTPQKRYALVVNHLKLLQTKGQEMDLGPVKEITTVELQPHEIPMPSVLPMPELAPTTTPSSPELIPA